MGEEKEPYTIRLLSLRKITFEEALENQKKGMFYPEDGTICPNCGKPIDSKKFWD